GETWAVEQRVNGDPSRVVLLLEPELDEAWEFLLQRRIDGNAARGGAVLIFLPAGAEVARTLKCQPVGVRIGAVHDANAAETQIDGQLLGERGVAVVEVLARINDLARHAIRDDVDADRKAVELVEVE